MGAAATRTRRVQYEIHTYAPPVVLPRLRDALFIQHATADYRTTARAAPGSHDVYGPMAAHNRRARPPAPSRAAQ